MADPRLITPQSTSPGSTVEVDYGARMASDPPGDERSTRDDVVPLALSDAELLQRFIESADAVAFTELVSRYECLVMGVALRQVGDRHRAEDVFQATFLVLAEQARRIRKRDSLSCWLHGTARRIGLRALSEQQRIQPMNDHMPEPAVDAPPLAEIQHAFEQQTLDEELAAMTEHLRLPLILHYLDGLTAKEVSQRLDLTVETVEGRLKKGRRVLREQLMKHGIGFSVVLAAFQLSQQLTAATRMSLSSGMVVGSLGGAAGLASGGSSLATATANSALAWTQHQPLADCTANAVRLASQELATMTALKSFVTLGITVALSLTAGFGGALAWGQFGSGAGVQSTTRGSRWVLSDDRTAAGSYAPGEAIVEGEPGAGVDVIPIPIATPFTPGQALAGPADYRSLSGSRSEIERVLDDGKLDLNFAETELNLVVEFLADQLQVPMVIDRIGLSDLGLNADEITVSVKVDGLNPHEALNFLLRDVGNRNLDYIIRDGVLTITTKDVADEFTEVVIYEVRHLGPNYPPQDIALLIESMVDGWEDEGYRGTVRIIPGGVVVRQTQRGHREIRAFFKQLEQFAARTDLPPVTRDPRVMELNSRPASLAPPNPDAVPAVGGFLSIPQQGR